MRSYRTKREYLNSTPYVLAAITYPGVTPPRWKQYTAFHPWPFSVETLGLPEPPVQTQIA